MVVLLLWLSAVTGFAKGPDKDQMVKFPGGKCIMYRLYLSDKSGSSYSLARPEEFLSVKSLERRRRQSLTLDSTDLPVSPAYIERIETTGLEVVSKSRWNNTVVVRGRTQKQFRALNSLPFVRKTVKVFTPPGTHHALEGASRAECSTLGKVRRASPQDRCRQRKSAAQ